MRLEEPAPDWDEVDTHGPPSWFEAARAFFVGAV